MGNKGTRQELAIVQEQEVESSWIASIGISAIDDDLVLVVKFSDGHKIGYIFKDPGDVMTAYSSWISAGSPGDYLWQYYMDAPYYKLI
jgi:hypothetical protein